MELWGNENKYTFPIEKKLQEVSAAAAQSLKKKQPSLEARDWSQENTIDTLEKQFSRAFKYFLQGSYVPKPVPASYSADDLKAIPMNAAYLYIFLKSEDFKNKDLPTFLKNINNIQFKARAFNFGSRIQDVFWGYCKNILNEGVLPYKDEGKIAAN